ncbi:uncharacterized protein LOC131651277 [Vicia villosa]|uniref:uncharacterized protein LOC131651277 n=1 Tax=Vicia villosa TaxID=3911 RepID=UPI00273CABF0|nr:uncharacterized protein LOC131651277 [Vicia villosa]
MVKRKRICQILSKAKADICFIQETKIRKMEEGIINSIWGKELCEWSALDSEGQSGGLVTIWKKGVIRSEFSFKAKGLLGINASWEGINCYFLNVYSSCEIAEKRILWNQLIEWKNKFPKGEWIIGGDFNAIKVGSERIGRLRTNRVEMEEFSRVIELLEVIDLPVVGNKFTWINSNGKAKSRINRILLSDGIIDKWKIVAQVTGNRDISDHRLVWIKACNKNWGAKPFKVFNCWYEHPEFENFVREVWNSQQVTGTSAFVLKEKIKRLRERLCWWNLNVFGWLDLRIEEDVEELNKLEEELVVSTIQGEDSNHIRKDLQTNIWKNLHYKESVLKQKARVRWIKEGDNNSKYFHSCLKSRSRRNNIVSLQTAQGTLEGVEDIKAEDFHNRASLPRALSASFIALIPKVEHPQGLEEFRPICLIGCIYKIVSKLLAARLRVVIGKLVSNSQTAFVPGRQILDGVLVANEIIDLAKRTSDIVESTSQM